MENQTPELCQTALQNYGKALRYIVDQTLEDGIQAVAQNPEALRYVIPQNLELVKHYRRTKPAR